MYSPGLRNTKGAYRNGLSIEVLQDTKQKTGVCLVTFISSEVHVLGLAHIERKAEVIGVSIKRKWSLSCTVSEPLGRDA